MTVHSKVLDILRTTGQGAPGDEYGAAAWLLHRLSRASGQESRVDVNAVGDLSFSGRGVASSLPIESDVWFLYPTVNLLTKDDRDPDAVWEKMTRFLEHVQDEATLYPLRMLRSLSDLTRVFDYWEAETSFVNNGESYIHEIRYETMIYGRSEMFISLGPNWYRDPSYDSTQGLADRYAGYLAIPVGPLGVIGTLSVVSEAMMKDPLSTGFVSDFSLEAGVVLEAEDDDEEIKTYGDTSRRLLPPGDVSDKCKGIHLIEKAYNLVHRDTEYPAAGFAGYTDVLPHAWLRLWLDRDECWPMPGEFVGVLAKPIRPHVWWFQRSSPFLYAGNWFETEHYTSGVVEEVIPPDEAQDEVGSVYKVNVNGESLYVQSSDFLEYSVGERVTVLKVGATDTSENFNWSRLNFRTRTGTTLEEQEEIALSVAGLSERELVQSDLMILPITFYKKE